MDDKICLGCKIGQYEVVNKCFEDNQFALSFLERHRILPSEIFCPNCNVKCSLRANGNQFRCRNILNKRNRLLRKECPFSVSKFKSTFLENTKLEPWKMLLFINIFLQREISPSRADTNDDWKSFCDEVYEKCGFSAGTAISCRQVFVS